MMPENWFSARMTIPGLLYLIGVIFIVLRQFGIKDLGFLSCLKDFELFTSAAILIASYLLGSLANTLLVDRFQISIAIEFF